MASSTAGRSVVSAAVRAVNTKKKFSPSKSALTVSTAAVQKIKTLMQERPDMIALKVGVKQRGCNGLTYTLEYVNSKGKFDEEVSQDGVKIFIDSKAQLSILGTEMDFVESNLSSEFIFNNPNVKGTCGCGESFNV